MKGTIIAVIAVFVIIATTKISEGKNCGCCCRSSKKPERKKANESTNIVSPETKADDNRNIVLPDRKKPDENKNIVLLGNSTPLAKYLHPVFSNRKICCLCKLPLCICKICKNPESWFLNPQLRAAKQEKGETSSTKPVKVTNRKAKVKANSTGTRVPSLREYNKIQISKSIYERKYNKGGFRLQCDCMGCKLCSSGKCGVVVKCESCGPVYLNGTSKKINFSKLLFKMNNKLYVNTKFLEINHS